MPAAIRGRLVFEGEAPAVGVLCEVHGWAASQERELKYDMPIDWTDPSGATDADGRFSIGFDPPRAFQFVLEAKARGFVGVECRLGEIEPGAVVDLGEITLLTAGTLEGRIVDCEGNPLLGQDWTVYARSLELDEGGGRSETHVIADIDPSTCRYRVEDVMPGRVELKAYSCVANWIDGPPIRLESGETLTVDIVYAGPDNSRRITVSTFSDTFNDPDPEHVKLICPSGETRTAEKIHGSSQSFSFDDLEPGTYALAIDDPRFLPWSTTAVLPGEEVDARLEGSSALVLNVVDEHGNAITDYSVRVQFRHASFKPDEFEVQPVLGVLDGMFPGDYTLRVRAGELLGAAEVDGLSVMETRALTVRVGPGACLSGRVIRPDGSPVADLEVLLLKPAEVDDSETSPILTKNMSTGDESRFRKVLDSIATDELGRFCFVLALEGPYVMHAEADGSEVSSGVHELTSAGKQGLQLVLPRGGWVRGTLRGSSGEPCSGFRVGIEPESASRVNDTSARMRQLQSASRTIVVLETDGGFELGPVPAGPATVYLHLAEKTIRMGSMPLADTKMNRVKIGKVTVEEGQVIERDFEVVELPGSIVLELTVNGAPAPGLQLLVHGAEGTGFGLRGETDANGTFGPTQAFPGNWTVEVFSFDYGWRSAWPGPIQVTSSAECRATVAIDVATAKVLFTDKETGKPLPNRPIAVFEDDFPIRLGSPCVTDSDGSASFTLTSGNYIFVLDADDTVRAPTPDERSATLTWTPQGPLVDRVQL